jgi:CheY-like chemotaxis protein
VTPPAPTPPAVLYAEDDENDAFLIRHAWRKAGIAALLHIVGDGQRAVDYLAGTGEYADRARFPLPTAVLLDLNMPRRSGLEVLRWIRAQPQFAALPISILSSSNQPKDLENATALGANAYFVKPANVTQLVGVVEKVRERWLS